MIDLTDLQEDILTLAVEDPDRTNEEIAEILDCSPDWVGEVRRKYEHKVNEEEVTDELLTVSGTTSNPPKPKSKKAETDRTMEIVIATGAWWVPIIVLVQGVEPTLGMWLFMLGGWVGVPGAIFLDCKERGSLGKGVIYTIGAALMPMFLGLVYLYRREQ